MSQRSWAIAYDIRSDRRRRRVEKVLQGYGTRVQYSVFEARLAPAHLRKLRAALREKIDAGKDSVRYYPMCAWCHRATTTLGTATRIELADYYLF